MNFSRHPSAISAPIPACYGYAQISPEPAVRAGCGITRPSSGSLYDIWYTKSAPLSSPRYNGLGEYATHLSNSRSPRYYYKDCSLFNFSSLSNGEFGKATSPLSMCNHVVLIQEKCQRHLNSDQADLREVYYT